MFQQSTEMKFHGWHLHGSILNFSKFQPFASIVASSIGPEALHTMMIWAPTHECQYILPWDFQVVHIGIEGGTDFAFNIAPDYNLLGLFANWGQQQQVERSEFTKLGFWAVKAFLPSDFPCANSSCTYEIWVHPVVNYDILNIFHLFRPDPGAMGPTDC